MILYRGMSLEEKEEFIKGNYNNVSWWSPKFGIAQNYSQGALVKISINLREGDKTEFKNASRGRDIEYEGYGQKNNFFSLSKQILEDNLMSFSFVRDIFPTENEDYSVLKEDEEYTIFTHTADGERIKQGSKDNVKGKEIFKFINEGAIVKLHQVEDWEEIFVHLFIFQMQTV